MKGLVFTTFYSHCEANYGADMLDDIIEDADLPNKGAYTSVGTYPFEEMVALITALVRRTGQALPSRARGIRPLLLLANGSPTCPAISRTRSLFDILSRGRRLPRA